MAVKFITSLALALCLSGCQQKQPRDPVQDGCRAAAVALAELEAEKLCHGQEWEACPRAEQIEKDLMSNLEKCDE